MTIPNIITILRLASVPVLIMLMINGHYVSAFLLFVAAGISDAIDGAIARHVPGQASALGSFLDPIADKALLLAIYVTLSMAGYVPVWLVILIVSRDVMIVGGVILSWVYGRPIPIEPIMVSKLNTAAQITYAAALMADLALHWSFATLLTILEYSVAILTLASAAAYLGAWLRHMSTPEQETRR